MSAGGWVGGTFNTQFKVTVHKAGVHMFGFMQGFVQQRARMECELPPTSSGWAEGRMCGG